MFDSTPPAKTATGLHVIIVYPKTFMVVNFCGYAIAVQKWNYN